MKRFIVCLANSKKYTQRCIAGVELLKTQSGFDVAKKNDEPLWIRPVSSCEHGEVASHLVEHISLLDIVEIDVTNPCPRGYQSENVLFREERLQVIRRVRDVNQAIPLLLTNRSGDLFGNKGRAVSVTNIEQLDYSLILIKPSHTEMTITRTQRGSDQVRAKFAFNGTAYDLPVTDIDFINEFTSNNEILRGDHDIYLTISLGVEFGGWHYKLVAGVIYF